ncbi:MAG: fumarate hydratase [Flavobacteriaceae bacterium]|nr:fumarate hydratase [Flavobacteriaceae bacterium]
MYAVISGDIITSSHIDTQDKTHIEDQLLQLLQQFVQTNKLYGRLIKGDYIECVLARPEEALRYALALKFFLKSISLKHSKDKRVKWFKMHALRLAIGFGDLSRFDIEKGRIDGEAIYLSGRSIAQQSTHHKKRIIIKRTLFFASPLEDLNHNCNTIFELLDYIASKATSKQSRILYLKLLSLKEKEIADQLNISQAVVNQQSISAGWNSIESAVTYFNQLIKERNT